MSAAILTVPPTMSHVGLTSPSESPFASMAENALAPTLDFKRIQLFSELTEQSRRDEPADLPPVWRSPLDAPSVAGLCDTFVASASCDPLRDEGEAYGRRLAEAGVRVVMRRYTGVPHLFTHLRPLQKAEMYNRDTCEMLVMAHRLYARVLS